MANGNGENLGEGTHETEAACGARLALDTDRITYSEHSEANLSNDFTSILGKGMCDSTSK